MGLSITDGYDVLLTLGEEELERQMVTALMDDGGIPWRMPFNALIVTGELEFGRPSLTLQPSVAAAPPGSGTFAGARIALPMQNSVLEHTNLPRWGCRLEGVIHLDLTFRPLTGEDGEQPVVAERLSIELQEGAANLPAPDAPDPSRRDRGGPGPEASLEAVERVIDPLEWNDVRPQVEGLIIQELQASAGFGALLESLPLAVDATSRDPFRLSGVGRPAVHPSNGSTALVVPITLLDAARTDAALAPPDFKAGETTAVVIEEDYMLRGIVRTGLAQGLLPWGPVAVDGDLAVVAGESREVDVRSLVRSGQQGIEWSTLTVFGSPEHGAVSIRPSEGNLTYEADEGFQGTDSFRFRVCDEADPARCAEAVVTCIVRDLESPDQLLVTRPRRRVGTRPASRHDDDDFQPDADTLTVVDAPAEGEVEVGGGRVRYTPAEGFQGIDRFTYEVIGDTDDGSETRSATIEVAVLGPAPEPVEARWVALDDAIRTFFDPALPLGLRRPIPLPVELEGSDADQVEDVKVEITALRGWVERGRVGIAGEIRGTARHKGTGAGVNIKGDFRGSLAFTSRHGRLEVIPDFGSPDIKVTLRTGTVLAILGLSVLGFGLVGAGALGLALGAVFVLVFNEEDPFGVEETARGAAGREFDGQTDDLDAATFGNLLRDVLLLRTGGLEGDEAPTGIADLFLAGRLRVRERPVRGAAGSIVRTGGTDWGPPYLRSDWHLELDPDLITGHYDPILDLPAYEHDLAWASGGPVRPLDGTRLVDLGTRPVWEAVALGQADIVGSGSAATLPVSRIYDAFDPQAGHATAIWEHLRFGDPRFLNEQVTVRGLVTGNHTQALVWLWRSGDRVLARYRIYRAPVRRVTFEIEHEQECVDAEILEEETVWIPDLVFGHGRAGGGFGGPGRDARPEVLTTQHCTYRHTWAVTAQAHHLAGGRRYAWTVTHGGGEHETLPAGRSRIELDGEDVRFDVVHDQVTIETKEGHGGSFTLSVTVTDRACDEYWAEREFTFAGRGVRGDSAARLAEEMRRTVDILAAAAAGYFDREPLDRIITPWGLERWIEAEGDLSGRLRRRVLAADPGEVRDVRSAAEAADLLRTRMMMMTTGETPRTREGSSRERLARVVAFARTAPPVAVASVLADATEALERLAQDRPDVGEKEPRSTS